MLSDLKNILDGVRRLVAARFVPFCLCLIVALQINNEFQRKYAVADLKTAGRTNRSMLNSRAQIQIILINATLENRQLNALEIDRIKQLWEKAEYNQTLDIDVDDEAKQ